MAVEVRAPLNGSILDIMVEPGAKVEVDDELLVIEAMKMQNTLVAERDGTVAELLTAQGESLAVDQPIIRFT